MERVTQRFIGKRLIVSGNWGLPVTYCAGDSLLEAPQGRQEKKLLGLVMRIVLTSHLLGAEQIEINRGSSQMKISDRGQHKKKMGLLINLL